MSGVHRFHAMVVPTPTTSGGGGGDNDESEYGDDEKEKYVDYDKVVGKNSSRTLRYVLIGIMATVGILTFIVIFTLIVLKYGFPDNCVIQSIFNTPCFNQRTYTDKCTNSYQCNISQLLICDNGYCESSSLYIVI